MKNRFFILILIFILAISACNDDFAEIDEKNKINEVNESDKEQFPKIVSNQFYQIFYNDLGERELIVYGQTERFYQNKNEIHLKDVQALILNHISENEVREIMIEADNGKLDLNTRNGEVWGNVVIIRENEVRIETNRLVWNNSLKKLYSEENEEVIIYKNDGTITKGKSLVAENDLSVIEIENAEISKE